MATPNPEQELERLQRSLRQGLPPVTVVTGPAGFFRSEAMDLLRAAVPAAAELRTIDAGTRSGGGGGGGGAARRVADVDADDGSDDSGDTDDAADAEESGTATAGVAHCPELLDLRGGGLFARQAFLCVRRGDGWLRRHGEALLQQLPKFAKGCGLLLEVSRLDRRTKLAKALVEAGAVYEFRELYDAPYDRTRSPLEAELVGWVGKRARALGIPLTPEAAYLLVVQVGKAPAELVGELGRLRDQLGSDPQRKPLRPDELRGRLTCSFESTPFEFAEAVLGNDRRKAMRSLRAMFDRGVRDKKGGYTDRAGLFPFITSWLFQSLTGVYEGRQLLDAGTRPRDLPGQLGVHAFADRLVEQVQQNTGAKLRDGLLSLLAVQRLSRTTGEEPDRLLERFLAAWFDGTPVPALPEFEA